MQVEIKSPTRIELTPETALEDTIVRGKQWSAKLEEPKPLEINKVKLVITEKKDG